MASITSSYSGQRTITSPSLSTEIASLCPVTSSKAKITQNSRLSKRTSWSSGTHLLVTSSSHFSRSAFSSKPQQPTSSQTVSVKSFETQLKLIPSQSHGVPHTKTTSLQTRNLEKSFKRFDETITSNLREKQSEEFQDFAAQIKDNINNALMPYVVKTFLEANSVVFQIKAFVQGDSNNTGKKKNRLKIKPSTNPSQFSGVTSTITISYTTQTPAVTLKGSDVIIMIIKRDYNSSLEDREGVKFQDFAREVQEEVNNALKSLKGFHSLLVKKIIQANSVIYQVKIFVQRDSNIKGKMKTMFSINLTGVLTETFGTTQTSSHTTALTPLSPPSITKVDSVNSLTISTQTNPTKSQSVGVSLSSISEVGLQTSGTLTTSQSSPISPFLSFVASHTTQTLSQASTFTSVSLSSYIDSDSVNPLAFLTQTTATKCQFIGVSLSSISAVGLPTSGTLTTSQWSPVSPSLSSAASHSTQTLSQASTCTSVSPSYFTDIDPVSSFAFSTPTSATQSQSIGVSLSSILELRSLTSGALTTSQSSPVSPLLSSAASHTMQTSSQASTFTSISLSSFIDADSVSLLSFLTGPTATQSQSIGVSLSSISAVGSPTSSTLTTSQSSPISPFLSFVASHTTQTLSQASTFTSASLSSFIDVDSESPLSFLTGPTATQSQSIGVSLSSISAVGSPTSSTLTTSQSSPISPFLSFVASHTTQTLSQASTFTSASLSSFIDVDSVSPLAFLTQTTATQSQSIGVSLSSILELRSLTSGALTTSQSSPVSSSLSFVALHTTETSSQASTLTRVSLSSYIDADSVGALAFLTQTTATQSQSVGVSLLSISAVGSQTSGTLTTSQWSPVSPSLSSTASHTTQTLSQASTFTSVSPSSFTDVDRVSSFQFSTPTTATQSQSYAVSLSSILELGSPTSGALPKSQLSPVSPSLRSVAADPRQTSWQATVSRVTVTIANEVYTEEFADNTSVQFKKLSKKIVFKDVNVEQETAEATKQLSTGIASIRSETSSKAKTSQILRLSTRASRSFRMDMYVTSSSLFSTTAPISKSPQPTSVSTTSATSFKTQTEPSPSQSSEITPTTTISPTTQKPEVSLKRFNVTMTITNRDYNSSLGDKESQEFQNLAAEVRDNVKNALNDSKGFISSEVEKFLEANSVTFKLKIVVLEDSDITKETMKVSLENSSGSLKLTDVTVVDTEMPITMAVTDKKPEVSLKRFNVTMTITNRDYNSSLGDKESQEFQNLAAEVRDNVKNALNDSKGFISSEVEKFLEANSVTCKLKILVREDLDITKEMIKVSLENSSGSLKLTDVTVVDAEMPTTMAVTDKKRLPNPLRKR